PAHRHATGISAGIPTITASARLTAAAAMRETERPVSVISDRDPAQDVGDDLGGGAAAAQGDESVREDGSGQLDDVVGEHELAVADGRERLGGPDELQRGPRAR